MSGPFSNSPYCQLCGAELEIMKSYNERWFGHTKKDCLAFALARAEKAEGQVGALREDISNALLYLGTGKCKVNTCEDCKSEEAKAEELLKDALAATPTGETTTP